MLQMGIIEKIKAEDRDAKDWASPIVLVPKPDSSTRLCVNFRKVNKYTDADPFPLPRIEDLVERVGRAKFLTKIDMTRGYWQVPLDDVFVPISAFVTPEGLFRWKYMPFWLKNAPATLSRLVAKLLQGLEMFRSAYLDDIIIFSDTWYEHLDHIKQVFDRIRNAGITLNKRKCEFAAAELDYLGHHVGLGKVEPKRQKVKAISDFPEPSNPFTASPVTTGSTFRTTQRCPQSYQICSRREQSSLN